MSDIEKNTVPSEHQVNRHIICDNHMHGKTKLLFIGNSITYHEQKPEIGWYGNYGMAASRRENDYVHRLCALLESENVMTAKCVVNVADWERTYKNGDEILESGIYREAINFDADIIIVRLLENCPLKDWDDAAFKKNFLRFLEYFNPAGKAKIILSTAFWRHSGCEIMKAVAEEKGLQCVDITDLGDRDDMKALGKFEHGGVAVHPGDLGMERIAERFLPAVLKEARQIGFYQNRK